MAETKFAIIDASGILKNVIVADQKFIDDVKSAINDPNADISHLYTKEDKFVEITSIEPSPSFGWYQDGAGNWFDGNPKLTADRASIPADGITSAKVTFFQIGPKAPTQVSFNVNGLATDVALVSGVAVADVTSTNPGDTIVVAVGALSVTITVVG